MRKRHVSLKDLAKELEVSISTVSRALRNHPDISPDLTEKIKRLALKRNYSPNPLAMGLLRQQTNMIGVIVPDLVTHFFASIIFGIESAAKENGYYIIIASSNESYQKEAEAVKNLLNTRVDGIIACLSQETERFDHFERILNNEIPLVFFDRVCETLNTPAVTVDGNEAVKKIIHHLHQNGCKRIAYISGPNYLNISKNRKKGYLQGLKECNLRYDPELFLECNLNPLEAKIATEKLLNLPQTPDAIFGINDTVIFAAMKEIKRRGLKIPADIALVGFTDEFHATVVDPPLTSVVHPTYRMGEEATHLFLKARERVRSFSQQVILQTELVIRESSIRE